MANTINLDGSAKQDIVLNEKYDYGFTLEFDVDIVGNINMVIANKQGDAPIVTIPFTLSGIGNRIATISKIASTNNLNRGEYYYEIDNNRGGGSHDLIWYGQLSVTKRSRS